MTTHSLSDTVDAYKAGLSDAALGGIPELIDADIEFGPYASAYWRGVDDYRSLSRALDSRPAGR